MLKPQKEKGRYTAMKVTLVDIRRPNKLFSLLDAFEGPVLCCGMDLRHNQRLQDLICGMADPEHGVPKLELTVSDAGDVSCLLRYMRDGGRAAA